MRLDNQVGVGKDIMHKVPSEAIGIFDTETAGTPNTKTASSDVIEAEQEASAPSPCLLEKASATTFSLPCLHSTIKV